ncbi:MAG: septum site-determining protein MinC [Defluviitaleaceae bacterium]|nr:septum site-determining protein MinC [Defluviitaleaceae bacterium]
MGEEKLVVFKGKRDGISIWLEDKHDFDVILAAFKDKTESSKDFFSGSNTNVNFTGRKLLDEQKEELMAVLKKAMEVTAAEVKEDAAPQPPKSAESADIFKPLSLPERTSVMHEGTLRSGQSIRYAGDVIILGDVNPGAEIVAAGNIIILGSLKGTVHAGCTGNDKCFVSALVLAPMQLRICDKITHALANRKKTPRTAPSYAYINEGQIYIAPLI